MRRGPVCLQKGRVVLSTDQHDAHSRKHRDGVLPGAFKAHQGLEGACLAWRRLGDADGAHGSWRRERITTSRPPELVVTSATSSSSELTFAAPRRLVIRRF